MQSISKTTVSRSAAQQIICSVFGAQARIRSFSELTEGYFNAAYAIALDGGRRCVLKVAPPDTIRVLRYEQQIMSAEVAVMQLVRQSTTMPVPAIYAFDTSRRILDSAFFLMEFVPGVPLHTLRNTLSPTEQQTIDRAIGAYLREMNDISGPSFGYAAPSAPRYSSWAEAFPQMLEDVLADGAALEVRLPRSYDDLRQQLRAWSSILADVTTPQLVHWDLWDGNIFIDPASKQIAGIIDFERALWGDPLMEFQFRTLAAAPDFVTGYGRPMLETEHARQRRLLYNIYLYLIMVIECAYRQYPTQDQERWSREQLAVELERLTVDGAASALS
jgi:aminoglycoside phosphotransferase (APT) family kinase protein